MRSRHSRGSLAAPVVVRLVHRALSPSRWGAWLVAVMLVCLPLAARAAEPTYEGFGAVTSGGLNSPVVHVTSLLDSGPGTLREALAGGFRTIVFDVAGDIVLSDFLYVNGPFVTIDGLTAPHPGITLHNRGLVIWGRRGAHDVIVRGIRVRHASIDGIAIGYGAASIVIDHCSLFGSGDGNLDITEDSRDVTVSWTILARPAVPEKNMLIKYQSSRITLHHNLFTANQRNPLVSIDDDPSIEAADTTVDMRNNLVWNWGKHHGTMVRNHARANVVANFYFSPSSLPQDRAFALIVCPAFCQGIQGTPGRAYVAENVNFRGRDVNGVGTEPAPFPAPPVTTVDACSAASAVVAGAGVRPLDAIDTGIISGVSLPPCVPDLAVQSLLPRGIVGPGQNVAVDYTVANVGAARSGSFNSAFWLSADATLGVGDRLLARVPIDRLLAGASQQDSVTMTLPSDVVPGVYRVIAVADPDGAVADPVRGNNTKITPIRVQGADLDVYALTAPLTVAAGTAFQVTDTTGNLGAVAALASSTHFYLSHNAAFDRADLYLGERTVPALAPGAASTGRTQLVVPSGTPLGTYYLLAAADATNVVRERSETNNTRWRALVVTVR